MRQNIIDAIDISVKCGLTPNLIGDTGVGKTEMVKEIAKNNNRKLIILNLATQEPADLIGLPYEEEGTTHWAKPVWWPSDGNSIILIDEINRAKKDVINAIFPLILNKSLHAEHELPEDTWIISAMNPDTEDFGLVFSFDDAAFVSRFVHLIVTGDMDGWMSWMDRFGFKNKNIIDILNIQACYPDDSNIEMPFDIKPKYRSLTCAYKLIEQVSRSPKPKLLTDALYLCLNGLIGTKATVEVAMKLDYVFNKVEKKDIFSKIDFNDIPYAAEIINDDKDIEKISKYLIELYRQSPSEASMVIKDVDAGLLYAMFKEKKLCNIYEGV